jgi:hypothetical protein
MNDRSQNDLERIFEKRYILKEAVMDPVASRLASKPIQQIINVIVNMVDLPTEVSPALIARVVDEEKVGELISALEARHLPIPKEIAHAIAMYDSGMEEIGDESDEVDVAPKRELSDELDLSKPRFGEIPDEESKDEEERSISLDPSMR